jgi:IS30 family transposase
MKCASALLRQYFAKGTVLSRYTLEHLTAVEDEINNRPRRVLGDPHSYTAFHRHCEPHQTISCCDDD